LNLIGADKQGELSNGMPRSTVERLGEEHETLDDVAVTVVAEEVVLGTIAVVGEQTHTPARAHLAESQDAGVPPHLEVEMARSNAFGAHPLLIRPFVASLVDILSVVPSDMAMEHVGLYDESSSTEQSELRAPSDPMEHVEVLPQKVRVIVTGSLAEDVLVGVGSIGGDIRQGDIRLPDEAKGVFAGEGELELIGPPQSRSRVEVEDPLARCWSGPSGSLSRFGRSLGLSRLDRDEVRLHDKPGNSGHRRRPFITVGWPPDQSQRALVDELWLHQPDR
jgi:hypothetical protein